MVTIPQAFSTFEDFKSYDWQELNDSVEERDCTAYRCLRRGTAPCAILPSRQAPLLVHPPTDEERQALAAGLRSGDACPLRRCQIVLASARGEHTPAIARSLGCSDQTVRNAIRAFHAHGVAALRKGSSRPHTIHAAFAADGAERLRALLHRSPRDFGQPTSIWTLELAAAVAFAEGLTATRVSDETVRATLARLGIRWRRAKHWITSPDSAYAPKNSGATG
jgi:transposase